MALAPAGREGRPGSLTRISHTHGPKHTPRNHNLLSGLTVPREARTLTGVTGCGMGDIDLQPVAVRQQVSQVRHHPDGAAGQGAPLPARRSAWRHGRQAPVQRPRGAFGDSASVPEYEESGLTVGPRYSSDSVGPLGPASFPQPGFDHLAGFDHLDHDHQIRSPDPAPGRCPHPSRSWPLRPCRPRQLLDPGRSSNPCP